MNPTSCNNPDHLPLEEDWVTLNLHVQELGNENNKLTTELKELKKIMNALYQFFANWRLKEQTRELHGIIYPSANP